MQRVGLQRLALGLARGAMQRPGAPEIDGDIDQQNHERNRRDRRRRRAVAQMADGLDHDAAGQHIEQGDDAERRQALDLAVAVVMLLVGGLVGNPHHQPGDDGGDQIGQECSASEISARLPMATPTTNFTAAMLALAKIEIAATRDFSVATGGTLIGAV